MSAVFITATGTDIGKTFVAEGLIAELLRRGRAVAALKPVVSGFDERNFGASDPARLVATLQQPVTIEAIAHIAPWRFCAPLAPDVAARRERRILDVAALVAFTQKAIAEARDAIVIEGIGGVMVPLDDTLTVLDWMAAVAVPALLVAGSYLGTISHSLTALDVLKARRIPVLAVIVSETAGSTVALEDQVASIARLAGDIPILPLPRMAPAAPHPTFACIADLL